MKKILTLISIVVFWCSLSSCGKKEVVFINWKKLEITGKVCDKSNWVSRSCDWNYVWWAAMNFAWNEMKENILKENVILDTKDKNVLELAKKFNNSIVTKNILDEKSYYIKSGYGQKTVDLINKESKEKFPEKSFWPLNIWLGPNDIISYAYFYKKVEYKEPFNKKNITFKWRHYKWFEAINSGKWFGEIVNQRENVKILNYENDDKFIVKLNLKDNSDELILVKGYDMDSPEQAINAINKYDKKDLEHLQFNRYYQDYFEAPNIKLDYHRGYESFLDKKLLNKVLEKQCLKDGLPKDCYKISAMQEKIKFNMDNEWAKVENEAFIWFFEVVSASVNEEEPDPIIRHFYLNDDYWIIMKRTDKKIPYFILWVKNDNLMEKAK